MKKFYFMAGLPRAGSTLLSTILNQNPNIYSSPSSPIPGLMLGLQTLFLNDELFKSYPKHQQASNIISSVIHNYYADITKPIVIDKNRSWTENIDYIFSFIDSDVKILCPVRNIDEILASFISMHHRNPYEINGKINFIDEMLIKNNIPLTDDNRCMFLSSDAGVLGQAYSGMKNVLLAGRQKNLHFIEYDDLIFNPKETMNKIYDFLEQPHYEHDFSNLKNEFRENDAEVYGLSDMHMVRQTLEKTSNDPTKILSENIIEKCKNLEFWRNLDISFDENDNVNDEQQFIGG